MYFLSISTRIVLQKDVRAQDSIFVIISVAVNPLGRDMCWEFFKSNSARLLEQYEVNRRFFIAIYFEDMTRFDFFIAGWIFARPLGQVFDRKFCYRREGR